MVEIYSSVRLCHSVAMFVISYACVSVRGADCFSQVKDWLLEQGLTSPPTQYRLYGRQFTGQKTQPTVSKYWRKRRHKSKENPEKANNTKYSNTINRHAYNPLVYNNSMGWLRDGSHRGQGRQAWTAMGLPPWYPQVKASCTIRRRHDTIGQFEKLSVVSLI